MIRFIQRLLGAALSLFVLALFATLVAIRPFFYDAVHMPSAAMAPTVAADSYVLVDKYGFGVATLASMVWRYAAPTRLPAHGDVVIYRVGGAATVGRVLAVSGDTFGYYNDGSIKLNDVAVPQTTVDDARAKDEGFEVREEALAGRAWRVRLRVGGASARPSGRYKVPPGTYFVLGDSRDQVADSRDTGTVALRDITAIVLRTSSVSGSKWPKEQPSWVADAGK